MALGKGKLDQATPDDPAVPDGVALAFANVDTRVNAPGGRASSNG